MDGFFILIQITRTNLAQNFPDIDLTFLMFNQKNLPNSQILEPNIRSPEDSQEAGLKQIPITCESQSMIKPTIPIPEFKIITSDKKYLEIDIDLTYNFYNM